MGRRARIIERVVLYPLALVGLVTTLSVASFVLRGGEARVDERFQVLEPILTAGADGTYLLQYNVYHYNDQTFGQNLRTVSPLEYAITAQDRQRSSTAYEYRTVLTFASAPPLGTELTLELYNGEHADAFEVLVLR